MMNNMVPRIVEIVGPAGVGKSTLCNVLSQSRDSVHLGDFPDARKISYAPFFVENCIRIFPSLFSLPRHTGRKLTRREFAWLAILYGWPTVLQKELKNNKSIILDQGPVYLLAETNELGPEYLKRPNAEEFWRNLYSRWAGTLDMIVWLDAPDAELLKRIRSREKAHVVKNESVETTFEFLAGYRKAFERIISDLSTNHNNLQVLRFDTGQKSPQEIANQILFELASA
jgi:deoxyadenosine/deoxycytidine kinase